MTESDKYLEMPWSIEDTIENINEIKGTMKKILLAANVDGKGNEDAKELEFDFDRAINALEKQIPKKQGSIYADDSHLHIDCDGFVRCFKTKKDIRYPLISLSDLDYCPRCGQKLDWESDAD